MTKAPEIEQKKPVETVETLKKTEVVEGEAVEVVEVVEVKATTAKPVIATKPAFKQNFPKKNFPGSFGKKSVNLPRMRKSLSGKS